MESSMITLSTPTTNSPRSDNVILDSGTQIFYIGAHADEACSIPSRVSIPDYSEEEDRSYGEWMNIIRTLYKSLQQTDSKLEVERERRRSRENNIIKLARKLSKTDQSLLHQKQKVEKLREQLEIERTEKSLLDHRLQHYVYAYGQDVLDDAREEVEKELLASRKQNEYISAEYEDRIKKITKSLGQQCDDLCQEVIELNRININLQQQLKEQSTNGGGVISRFIYRRSLLLSKNTWKALSLRLFFAVSVAVAIAYIKSTGIISTAPPSTSQHVTPFILLHHETSPNITSVVEEDVHVPLEDTGREAESVTESAETNTTSNMDKSVESLQDNLGQIKKSGKGADEGAIQLPKRIVSWLRRRGVILGSRIKRHLGRTMGIRTLQLKAFLKARL